MSSDFRNMVIETLRRGEDLPPEWARELFPPKKREFELVYHGKERKEDILAETMAVPLQPVRVFGKNGDTWHNMLIFGENLQVLKSLLRMKSEGKLLNSDNTNGVRLVYIDPPFATKQEFRGSKDQKAYQDKIAGAIFVEFLRKRFVLIKELLSDNGSLFVHLDQRKSHYIKIVLDEIFGEQNFANEIIWRSTNTHNTRTGIGQIHQTVLYYRKSDQVLFNSIRRPLFKEHINKNYRHRDERGYYSRCDLTGPGIRSGDSGKPWRGYNPTASGRHWQPPSSLYDQVIEDISHLTMLDRLECFYKNGFIYLPANGGQPRGKLYLNPEGGNLIQDLWAYQPYTSGIYADSDEGIDQDVQWLQNPEGDVEYPTQKPEGVLSRIVRMSTNPGDIVLDSFAGSGTTCAVAEKLGRRWIGVDSGKMAIYTIQKRMLNLTVGIGNKGQRLKAKPFMLYNAGLYDFSTLKKLPWNDWLFFSMQLFGCREEPHSIGGLKLHGKIKGSSVLVFNHLEHPDRRIDEETIKDIHSAVGKSVGRKFFIIAPRGVFDFQEDYLDIANVRYYALRIPYSVINELHHREFTALQQPIDETEVNNIVDAWGFDFNRPPKVEFVVGKRKRDEKLFEEAFLKIKRFTSFARQRGEDVHGALETFSMVMFDFDYDGDIFNLDAVFYAHQMEGDGWEARFPTDGLGDRIMAVFIDIHGNESMEVIPQSRFILERDKNAAGKQKLRKLK